MKAVLESIPKGQREALYCEEIRGREFGCAWHFHPEYELTLTLSGTGYRMVGDDVTPLRSGDLVLLGPNLPHDWQHVPATAESEVHAIVVQFEESFLGAGFWTCAEAQKMRHLLQRAASGLQFKGSARVAAANGLSDLPRLGGMDRILLLLQVLHGLSTADTVHEIASAGFSPVLNKVDEGRMRNVAQYLDEHLGESVYLADVARVANLSGGAFARFIKSRTGKTFSRYLMELRVGRACDQLANSSKSITEIAFDCGYQNLSNFNRQFRKLKGMTPRAYRKLFPG